MKIDVKNIEGKTVKSIDLDDAVFGVEEKKHAVYLVAKAQMANKRQGTHATKTRSLVSGGGKKPFKQKGTGNARQGTSRAPHMPGGAVVHGPQNRDYTQNTNKKLRRVALQSLLSNKARTGKLTILDDFPLSGFNTKIVAKSLAALGVKSAVIADERKDQFLYRSARNIPGLAIRSSSDVSVLDLLGHQDLVLTESSLKVLSERAKGASK